MESGRIGQEADRAATASQPSPEEVSGIAGIPCAAEVANALFGLFRLACEKGPDSMILTPEMVTARNVLGRMAGEGKAK